MDDQKGGKEVTTFAGEGGRHMGCKDERNEIEEYEFTWSPANKTLWRIESYQSPSGRPALDFLAGVTSLGVQDSEKEAVLVGAGV